MTPSARLTACTLVAALLVGAALAWLQWPLADAGDRSGHATPAGQAGIEDLRAQLERERERLQAARREQDRTAAELRALEAALEASRERVERLQRELREDSQPAP